MRPALSTEDASDAPVGTGDISPTLAHTGDIPSPVLEVGKRHAQLQFNFGQKPFIYQDIDEQNRLLEQGKYHVAEREEAWAAWEKFLCVSDETRSDDGLLSS
jgi:hypothetical protein